MGYQCNKIHMIKHILEIVISMFFLMYCIMMAKIYKIGFDLRIIKPKWAWYSDQKDPKIGLFKHVRMQKPESFRGLCPVDPRQGFTPGPHQGPLSGTPHRYDALLTTLYCTFVAAPPFSKSWIRPCGKGFEIGGSPELKCGLKRGSWGTGCFNSLFHIFEDHGLYEPWRTKKARLRIKFFTWAPFI